ncbi:hypothetical protein [Leptospira neocaledonica]|nr:hypothetical protein [Leptospira neocaledonica]
MLNPEELESDRYIRSRGERSSIELSLISGYVVLFDLVNSTKIKSLSKGQAADWISTFLNFYEIVVQTMNDIGDPIKFLGDGVFYVFPDTEDVMTKKILSSQTQSSPETKADQLLDKCIEVIEYLDKQNSEWLEQDRFYLTITLDYGNKIFNPAFLDLGTQKSQDYLGLPIDRAFRINGITGHNYISLSESFYNKVIQQNRFKSKDFEKIRMKPGTLKGIEDETCVWIYSKPYYDQSSLSHKRLMENKLLVEDEKLLGSKIRIHLLKNIINAQGGK